MPIVQVLGPYPTFATVMNLARAYVNDTMAGITGATGEGQILTNSAPMTIPFLRAVVSELYQELGNVGAGMVIRDNFVLTGLTPINGANGLASPDTTTQVKIGYDGYFDGASNNSALSLPADLIAPLKVSERTTATNDTFAEMTEAPNGLGSQQQGTYQGSWEWRQDGLWMPGSLLTEDISIRYICALPLLSGTPDLATVSVPIADCENALALKLAANYGFARGSDQVQMAEQKADKAVGLLKNRYVRALQAVDYRMKPYGQTLWPLGSLYA